MGVRGGKRVGCMGEGGIEVRGEVDLGWWGGRGWS